MTEIEALRQRVDALAAREEIRDVLHAFTRHLDRLDAEGAKTCYHPDAQDIHWGSFVGNAHAFCDYMIKELSVVKFMIHEVTNPIIDLQGDRAFVESRYTSRIRLDYEGAPQGSWVESTSHGRYLDIFERLDNAWKIAHRRLALDGGTVALVTDLGQYNHDGAARRFPEDYVYKGFDILNFAPEPTVPVQNRFHGLRDYAKRLLPRA